MSCLTRLTLLDSPSPARPRLERPLSLLAQPGRPGHVLTAVELALDTGMRKQLNTASVERGVPAGLLAALSIEAIRHVGHACAIASLHPDELIEVLDHCAAESLGAPPVIAIEARRLTAYITALSSGGCSTALPGGVVMVPVIAPVAAAWAVEAARVGQPVGLWAVAQLRGGAMCGWEWELAAASAGASLGEWIQAAALRALVAASAHPRT